jgi:hypothetical protein
MYDFIHKKVANWMWIGGKIWLIHMDIKQINLGYNSYAWIFWFLGGIKVSHACNYISCICS